MRFPFTSPLEYPFFYFYRKVEGERENRSKKTKTIWWCRRDILALLSFAYSRLRFVFCDLICVLWSCSRLAYIYVCGCVCDCLSLSLSLCFSVSLSHNLKLAACPLAWTYFGFAFRLLVIIVHRSKNKYLFLSLCFLSFFVRRSKPLMRPNFIEAHCIERLIILIFGLKTMQIDCAI
jgi:hypothetical protein